MSPELYAALIGLGIALVAGLAGLAKWLFDRAPGYLERIFEAQVKRIEAHVKRIDEKVDENTDLTKDVRKQTNGELAKWRDQAARLLWERDAYRDMVRFVNRNPNGRAILTEYAERRQVRHSDADLDALLAAVPPATAGEEPKP